MAVGDGERLKNLVVDAVLVDALFCEVTEAMRGVLGVYAVAVWDVHGDVLAAPREFYVGVGLGEGVVDVEVGVVPSHGVKLLDVRYAVEVVTLRYFADCVLKIVVDVADVFDEIQFIYVPRGRKHRVPCAQQGVHPIFQTTIATPLRHSNHAPLVGVHHGVYVKVDGCVDVFDNDESGVGIVALHFIVIINNYKNPHAHLVHSFDRVGGVFETP